MEQKIHLKKKTYKREAIIVALQSYLKNYWVTIFEDDTDYCVQFESKEENDSMVSEDELKNQLVEAEFIYMKSLESLPLRNAIMKKALEPYHGKND